MLEIFHNKKKWIETGTIFALVLFLFLPVIAQSQEVNGTSLQNDAMKTDPTINIQSTPTPILSLTPIENVANPISVGQDRLSYPDENPLVFKRSEQNLPVVPRKVPLVSSHKSPSTQPVYSYSPVIDDHLRSQFTYKSCEEDQVHARRPIEMILKEEDFLDDEVRQWAKYYGYTLHWDARDYQVNNLIVLREGFEENLAGLLKGLDQNGIHLRAQIFNNCVLRISEEE